MKINRIAFQKLMIVSVIFLTALLVVSCEHKQMSGVVSSPTIEVQGGGGTEGVSPSSSEQEQLQTGGGAQEPTPSKPTPPRNMALKKIVAVSYDIQQKPKEEFVADIVYDNDWRATELKAYSDSFLIYTISFTYVGDRILTAVQKDDKQTVTGISKFTYDSEGRSKSEEQIASNNTLIQRWDYTFSQPSPETLKRTGILKDSQNNPIEDEEVVFDRDNRPISRDEKLSGGLRFITKYEYVDSGPEVKSITVERRDQTNTPIAQYVTTIENTDGKPYKLTHVTKDLKTNTVGTFVTIADSYDGTLVEKETMRDTSGGLDFLLETHSFLYFESPVKATEIPGTFLNNKSGTATWFAPDYSLLYIERPELRISMP
ncbi:MAG: hypothetical protein WC956_05705 [bacterium]